MTVVVAFCRAGFEAEAAADLSAVAAGAGAAIDTDIRAGSGIVVGTPRPFDSQRWSKALAKAPPVFVRSLFFGTGPHALLDAAARGRPDRAAPIAQAIARFRDEGRIPGTRPGAGLVFGKLRVEMPDTNDGKALSGICRAIEMPLAQALQDAGALAEVDAVGGDDRLPVLHVLLVDGATAYVGGSLAPWGSPHAMGIPRLHLPRNAPSRSTLKLAEAFDVFLGDRAATLLRPGLRAIDLGAAPGGWTWQLAQRGLRVTAIDNGPLKGAIVDDPLVTHLRVDGLTYAPRRPVDWMVCDIVLQPSRIAALVGRWIAEGHARRSIFNLKLPMKKRYDEVQRCRRIIEEMLDAAGMRCSLSLRQLYHDREEVTGFVERAG